MVKMKKRQFAAEFVEHCRESPHRSVVGRFNLTERTERLENDVNRPILKMEPPVVGQELHLRAVCHEPGSRLAGARGQGFSGRADTCRRPSAGMIDANGRT
jgi:hypothetical protein